jgi:SAM-dependent methyltransferase
MRDEMNSSKTKAFESIAIAITTAEYGNERIRPRPGQLHYLHLSDLQLALERWGTQDRITVLDYGCGGSPYRGLFPNAIYRRADAIDTEGLDYRVAGDESIQEKDEVFDLILSTQVLEHIKDPQKYLVEAYRLLRQGGRIVLTTHGMFEEHGCPYDFLRWTGDGLKEELKRAGFHVLELSRLTTDGRALAFLLNLHAGMLAPSRRHPFGLLFGGVAALLKRFQPRFHWWCDRVFANSRVVDESVSSPALAIALCVVGEKR